MKINKIVVGPIQTNCYLVYDETSKEAVIVDPGDESSKIEKAVRGLPVTVKAVLLTHGHFDHVTSAEDIARAFNVPVMIHKNDEILVSSIGSRIGRMLGFGTAQVNVNTFLNDGDKIKVGGSEFEVLLTPGHTQGSICLYSKNDGILISGDTVFKNDVGRIDLVGGSEEQMMNTLKEKLFSLPDETKVYPGHGHSTVLGNEKTLWRSWGIK